MWSFHIDILMAELPQGSAHGFLGWVDAWGRTLGILSGLPAIMIRVGMIVFT